MQYSAFISYSHHDRREAVRVHRALETYVVPRRLRGGNSRFGELGSRLPPVFRDRDELAADADLGASVKNALRVSATLLVLCSEAGAESAWVNEEIREFVRLGRRDRIICLELPTSSQHAESTLHFPPALFEGIKAEPLAADLRRSGDGRAAGMLKVIAAILAVPFDDLRQREIVRRQRRLLTLAGASGALAVSMSALALVAVLSRNDAIVQRDLARKRLLLAERTVSFVKSIFQNSDPSEARGRDVTARELLDRGVQKVDLQLRHEPEVRAQMLMTLGEVYGSLGLFRKGEDLVLRSLQLPVANPEIVAAQVTAVGDARFRQADYEGARSAYARVLKALRPDGADQETRSRALVGLGQSLSALGRNGESEAPINEALRSDRMRKGAGAVSVGRDLEALGLTYMAEGKPAEARSMISRALEIRLAAEGPYAPSVSDDLNSLGSIAYVEGNLASAADDYQRNLLVDEKVLGPNHPDFAATLNNLGRVYLDQRRFEAARPLFARALNINLAQRSATHDDLTFIYSNLGYSELGLGRTALAKAMLLKARAAATAHHHGLLGPITADLAALDCNTGDIKEGLALIEEARRRTAEEWAATQPWRLAWVDVQRAVCLSAQGRRSEAATLVRASRPAIRRRWAADTFYGHQLQTIAARLHT